ncbi:hypothetical protein DMN91_006147 [Ooceraea biroi]|uniref:Uncharacterized protein n=1 Tax=Ooceraea biroi TaxID=2015173 RepID=A0A3L8DN20_OOCBI|nr:hypothetical protein DMN91_006147 [Ooceraea biroi]
MSHMPLDSSIYSSVTGQININLYRLHEDVFREIRLAAVQGESWSNHYDMEARSSSDGHGLDGCTVHSSTEQTNSVPVSMQKLENKNSVVNINADVQNMEVEEEKEKEKIKDPIRIMLLFQRDFLMSSDGR